MKTLIASFTLALLIMGCSKKTEIPPTSQLPTKATDLGKDSNYFSGLYGTMKSQKSISPFGFSVPAANRMVSLNGPFLVQQYVSEKLSVTTVFPEKSTQAVWVKYVLPNPWTQEQINAALSAYGKKWAIADQNVGMNLLMQDRAPVVYKSDSEIVAHKTMVNELIFFAPSLVDDLHKKITQLEQQKRAVPKF